MSDSSCYFPNLWMDNSEIDSPQIKNEFIFNKNLESILNKNFTVHTMNKETIWQPQHILASKNNSGNSCQYGIVILNTQININPKYLLPLWQKASLRFTVDGGTNQWFKWLEKNKISIETTASPHYVTGDMDSIDVKRLEILRDQLSSKIVVTDDQNETDFTKSLIEIKKVLESTKRQLDNVIAVADTCGRLDQIMANINTMYKARTILNPNCNVYQLSNDSLSWLIYPGRHKIYIPDDIRENETWCAIIPVGEQCKHVTTTGLKWDLKDSCIKFGELVSTSNTYSQMPYVTIETDKPLLWSMGLGEHYGHSTNS